MGQVRVLEGGGDTNIYINYVSIDSLKHRIRTSSKRCI